MFLQSKLAILASQQQQQQQQQQQDERERNFRQRERQAVALGFIGNTQPAATRMDTRMGDEPNPFQHNDHHKSNNNHNQNHGPVTAVPISLRDQAMQRAAFLRSSYLDRDNNVIDNGYGSRRVAQQHQQQQQQRQEDHLRPSPFANAVGTTIVDQQQQQQQQQQNAALMARQAWRQHGHGVTQALEELRVASASAPASSASLLQQYHPSAMGSQQHQQQDPFPILQVRVVTAEDRVDVAGAKYTVYLLQTQFLASHQQQEPRFCIVEHRYSDFAKLHALLQQQEQPLVDDEIIFPAKHWAGRVGNWTPSEIWAPQQHADLIQYRTKQLDIWLVHVVARIRQQFQQQQQSAAGNAMINTSVAQAVYQFVTTSQPLPCHQILTSVDNPFWKRHNPVAFTLGSSIRQATHTVQCMCGSRTKVKRGSSSSSNTNSTTKHRSDVSIPVDLLHAARGLCFLTVVKAGMVLSGRVGTGLVVARLDRDNSDNNEIAVPMQSSSSSTTSTTTASWSAPVAVAMAGIGWGAQVGGDITHYLMVLTTDKAVQDLVANANTAVQLGAEFNVAVGPIGRGGSSSMAATAYDWTVHAAYAYAISHGFFVGMSLEGSVLRVRHDVNAKFYGTTTIGPATLLQQGGPPAAQPLYDALHTAWTIPLLSTDFRPSQLWRSPTATAASAVAVASPDHDIIANKHQR